MNGVLTMKVQKTVPAAILHNIIALPESFNGKNVTVTIEEAAPVARDTSVFDRAYSFLMTHTIKSDITIEEARDMRLFDHEIAT